MLLCRRYFLLFIGLYAYRIDNDSLGAALTAFCQDSQIL